jgi:hypothetical protein
MVRQDRRRTTRLPGAPVISPGLLLLRPGRFDVRRIDSSDRVGQMSFLVVAASSAF